MERRVLINLVFFLGVFVLMIYWAINNIVSFDFIERPYEISGEFAGTVGVSAGSEVALLGVNAGEVGSVESIEGGVRITMKIDRNRDIPVGSTAAIFRKSAIGEPYIDFNPPEEYAGDGPVIEPGTVIPLSDTTVPLEFSELLRSASRVLGAVDPEQTRTLVHELAVALQGRGDALRELTVSSDALLQTFAERTDLLDRLSANSTRLTSTVTDRRAALSSAISDLADLGRSLRNVEPDTRVLLERGSELLGRTADLVADVKGDLDCVLSDLESTIAATTTDEQLEHLAFTLENGPTALGYVFATRDTEPGGLWVRVNLIVNQENPAEVYVPPRELPAVPEIPACVSSLTTSGVRFESGPAAPPVAVGTLPATGGGPAAIAFVVLSSAALALAVRRRGADG